MKISKFRNTCAPLGLILIILTSINSFVLADIVKNEPSVFEEVVQANGGRVSYPFSDMYLQFYKSLSLPHESGGYLLVPRSRSIQQQNVDFVDPRVIGAISHFTPLFFGFAPRAKQVEVISWNRHHPGVNDFLILENYGENGNIRITHPPRSKCIICHQGESAIFPRAPWREFSNAALFGNDDKKSIVTDLVLAAQGQNKTYQGLKLSDYLKGQNILGMEGTDGNPPGSLFDGLVRTANGKLQGVRVINKVCKNDLECRRLILGAALLNPNRHIFFPVERHEGGFPLTSKYVGLNSRIYKELTAKLAGYWPQDNFGHPSSVLPDREILSENKFQGMVIRPLRSDGSDLTYSEFQTFESEDFQGISLDTLLRPFEFNFGERPMLPHEQALIYPATPRPLDGFIASSQAAYYVIEAASEALGFEDLDIAKIKRMPPSKLYKSLYSQAADSLLVNWPPSVTDIVKVFASQK